jgi:Zn-dependent peptidase ImmA (M78 family)/DNA-binding XRE family transcriptional regulator
MGRALIQPKILTWARNRARLNIEDLAKKVGIKNAEKITSWELGVEQPTFKQAQKLAKALYIPFGYLFLENPPEDKAPIPDLRTVGDRAGFSYSPDLKEVIADVQRKIEWYKDYLKEIGAEKLPFAGKFDIGNNFRVISESITEALQLSLADRKVAPNWEAFLNLLVERAEETGIVVLRSGKVGNNTRRVLDVEEFRGFVVYDDYSPFVFINGADAKAAQIFTLIHELAHIWLGKSGVSDNGIAPASPAANDMERLCNNVAAEVLVPEKDLKNRWEKRGDFYQQLNSIASFYRVSKIVLARRLLDLGFIEEKLFWSYFQQQAEQWKNKKKKNSGGSYYSTLPVNNGKKFTKAILYSVFSHKTLYRDGARLLGMKPANLNRLAESVGLL